MMQRRPRRRDEKHLRFVRERPCIICATREGVQPAHIKMADGRIGKPIASNNEKADDRFTLPLCWMHHADQHSHGERRWWDSYHLDPVLISLALYSITGDDEAGDELMRLIWTARIIALEAGQ